MPSNKPAGASPSRPVLPASLPPSGFLEGVFASPAPDHGDAGRVAPRGEHEAPCTGAVSPCDYPACGCEWDSICREQYVLEREADRKAHEARVARRAKPSWVAEVEREAHIRAHAAPGALHMRSEDGWLSPYPAGHPDCPLSGEFSAMGRTEFNPWGCLFLATAVAGGVLVGLVIWAALAYAKARGW